MSVGIISLAIGLGLFALMATGLPVAFCMLSVALVGYLVFVGPDALYTVAPVTFRTITTDIYVAIPLFIFMASMLQVSGIAERLYDTMYKWFAGLKGGLAIGTVAICTLIAGMTGVGATGTVTMGLLAYPEMRKRGYDKKLSLGCIPAGGALGPLIPPSIPAILVAGMTGVSVGKLFIAGIIPGVLTSLLFMLYIGFKCSRNPQLGPPIPVEERASWREKWISLGGAILPILLIVVILGGIYSGFCTPSEAGAIGAIGALICTIIYRNLNWKNLWSAVLMTIKANAMVMWLLVGGAAFSSLVGITGVKTFVSDVLTALPVNSTITLIAMLVIILILGMFIENASIIMICAPIFFPAAIALGFDPLWFCFLFVMCIIIGMVTPPFGYNLFFMKGLGHKDVTMADIYGGIWPFVPPMVIVLALCLVFPEIATWLPNQMIR